MVFSSAEELLYTHTRCFLGFDSWGCRAHGGGQACVGLECLTEGCTKLSDPQLFDVVHWPTGKKKKKKISHRLRSIAWELIPFEAL